MRVGIITGVQREAAILARSPVASSLDIRVGAVSAEQTAQHCRALIESGVHGLVSFGTCAGLSEALAPGALLVPQSIRLPNGETHSADVTWLETAARSVDCATDPPHRLLGSDRLIASVDDKARLAAETGAEALDMESHIVARAAADAQLPFLAVRAVADPASRAVPEWALDGIGPDGATRIAPIILNVVKRPRRAAALYRLWRDNAAAEAALRRVAGAVPAGFGLPGVGGL